MLTPVLICLAVVAGVVGFFFGLIAGEAKGFLRGRKTADQSEYVRGFFKGRLDGFVAGLNRDRQRRGAEL